jgi:uncharacterized protein YecE (DUF72 family)
MGDSPMVPARRAIRVGTAGWALPAAHADRFAGDGSHLARYARVFSGVEINSSFYRSHLRATYARWASVVPEDFRFSVKAPKAITHEHRLVGVDALLDTFVGEIASLGDKLGCVLVQLPPSLALDAEIAEAFLARLRDRYDGDVAVEPRHATWFTPPVLSLLERHRCTRVAADPACVPEAAAPGGWNAFAYWRLHGSPRMYASSYDDAYLDALAQRVALVRRDGRSAWCIFDNTMYGAAVANGITLQASLTDRLAAALAPAPCEPRDIGNAPSRSR